MINLYPTAEPVIVLRSTTQRTKKLLYLVGFEDEFVSNVLLENQGISYEIIQKHRLSEISIQTLIDLQKEEGPQIALICDLHVLTNNKHRFLKNIKKEKSLKGMPFIVINRTKTPIDIKGAIKKGIDDCYELPLKWDKIFGRIEFLIKHKKQVQNIGKIKSSNYRVPTFKRFLDIVAASCILLFLSPILLIIALLIKFTSDGPILYSSKRAGTNYKVFDFLKFRSMVVDADKKLEELSHLNQYDGKKTDGPSFTKIANDPRVTRVGKIIRKTSLDELPQLINVLKGDMSIIGNRPLPLYEAEQLTTDYNSQRFIAPAGLTGLWQVSKRGKKDMSVQERIDLDIEYALNHSLLMDIKIVAKTLPAMIQDEAV